MKLATALSAFAFIGVAAAQNAHMHGVGYLSISAEGSTLITEFITDQHTLYGFEGPPKSEAQRSVISDVAARLEGSHALVAMETSVTCQVSTFEIKEHNPEIELGGLDDHHDHTDDHDHHDEEEHRDIMIRSVYTCDGNPTVDGVNVTAFQQLPSLDTVHVVVLTDRQQDEEQATRSQHMVRF